MSFANPIALLALLVVPVAVSAYAAFDRRREGAAAAFATPAVRASATPVRPGWRRHAPLALHGLALVALIGALGRPHATLAVPAEQASIVLATDISGSMQATDVAPNRLDAARDAAERFLQEVPNDIRVGALAFNHGPIGLSAPTTDRQAVIDRLADLEPSGGTATGEAMAAALQQLGASAVQQAQRGSGKGAGRPPQAVVLLSDGASTRGRDPLQVAEEARRQGVPIYTVALGTPQGTIPRPDGSGTERVPPDAGTMRRVAEITGGEAFTALDDDTLDEVYERLGSQVATKDEEREVTAAFAGGGMLLALIGGALSLHWFRRLP
jgi:Ca-activated chloride channel family protein